MLLKVLFCIVFLLQSSRVLVISAEADVSPASERFTSRAFLVLFYDSAFQPLAVKRNEEGKTKNRLAVLNRFFYPEEK